MCGPYGQNREGRLHHYISRESTNRYHIMLDKYGRTPKINFTEKPISTPGGDLAPGDLRKTSRSAGIYGGFLAFRCGLGQGIVSFICEHPDCGPSEVEVHKNPGSSF
jgi:hypothetical protein